MGFASTNGILHALSTSSLELPYQGVEITADVVGQQLHDTMSRSDSDALSLRTLQVNGKSLFANIKPERMSLDDWKPLLDCAHGQIGAMLNRDGPVVDEVAAFMGLEMLALLIKPGLRLADVNAIVGKKQAGGIEFADPIQTGINIVEISPGVLEIIKTSRWESFKASDHSTVNGRNNDVLTATTRYRVSLKDSVPRFLIDLKNYLGLDHKFTTMLDVKHESTIYRSEDWRVLAFLQGDEAALVARIWNHIRGFFTGELGIEIRCARHGDVTALDAKLPELGAFGPDSVVCLEGLIQSGVADKHTRVATRAHGKSIVTATVETIMRSGRSRFMTHMDRFLDRDFEPPTIRVEWRGFSVEKGKTDAERKQARDDKLAAVIRAKRRADTADIRAQVVNKATSSEQSIGCAVTMPSAQMTAMPANGGSHASHRGGHGPIHHRAVARLLV